MLESLVNHLRGQVRLRVESAFPERILNLCAQRKLELWDVRWESATVFSCVLTRRDFRLLRLLARKLDCTLHVQKREGAPFLVGKLRRRQALAVCLIVCALGLFFSSFFIWDITVDGAVTVPEEEILRALEKNGVGFGTFGFSIDSEDLRNHILLDIPELSWLTVNVSGCRAYVQVRERVMSLGIAADSDERLQAAVIFELNHNESNGHVFLPRDKLVFATVQLLNCGQDLVEKALDDLCARGAVVQEQVANVTACYLRRLWAAEVSAVARLRALLSVDADQGRQVDKVIAEIEKAQGITYADQQRQAVALAARTGVLILTGGPGTGKTTTVRGIVALFQRMGLDVMLAAPTGRAAKRMSELCGGLEAQTIHRLLGVTWNENTRETAFSKCEKEPLEADAVIVDEMSMTERLRMLDLVMSCSSSKMRPDSNGSNPVRP